MKSEWNGQKYMNLSVIHLFQYYHSVSVQDCIFCEVAKWYISATVE